MKLYFLRHGLAGEPRDWKGDDFARPLTNEGIDKMKLSAATIAKLELKLDAILTSPLVRAKQTAEIVAQKLGIKIIIDERLGAGFNIDQLKKILRAYPNAGELMLVGHEPGFSETISALIGGGRVVCKKGALACVELENISSMRGELNWLLPPKVLAL